MRVVKSEPSGDRGGISLTDRSTHEADPGAQDTEDEFEAITTGEMCRKMGRNVVRSLVQFAKDVTLLLLLPFLFLGEWLLELWNDRWGRPRLTVLK